MSTEVLVALIMAVPTAFGVWSTFLTNKGNNKIDEIQTDVSGMKQDMSVCKEASFASLMAHVENGANGDVKKAYERLKDDLFER